MGLIVAICLIVGAVTLAIVSLMNAKSPSSVDEHH